MLLTLSILIMFSVFLLYFFMSKKKSKKTMNLLGGSAFLSLMLIIYWGLLDCPSFMINLYWLKGLQKFSVSFSIDLPFVLFSSMALFVTWSMMEFSHYYMKKDSNKKKFFKTLMFFLLFMLILVSSKNLFFLFMGWEGVGMLSFMLIGWWFTRADAKSAALQAIMYNRMGDSGMIMFLSLSMMMFKTWNLKEIFMLKTQFPFMSWALLGIIIAAAGKSAQFMLHPWLPSAMEGPTPVSALLHSSTMVVAGMFLLFRCFPLLNSTSWALPTISILGALTALFAASVALTQYDMKKVVAYSTTSQLGLMAVAIGIGIPQLALFHICTHAFFKALLFLCSGSIIHSLKKEQDLRKMGDSSKVLPLTTSCMMLGSLALCGIPFLAGFYSKDLILEAGQKSISKSLSIILSLIATLMTAVYSFRVIWYLKISPNTMKATKPISEENMNLMYPLLRLTLGVFISGWLMSICFFSPPTTMMPWMKKILPLFLMMTASILIFNNLSPWPTKKGFLTKIKFFLGKNWFYVKMLHGKFFKMSMKKSMMGVLRSLDQGWTSRMGASGMMTSLSIFIKPLQKMQTGVMTNYMFYLYMFSLMLIMLINLM